jgi:hypothetical protein
MFLDIFLAPLGEVFSQCRNSFASELVPYPVEDTIFDPLSAD